MSDKCANQKNLSLSEKNIQNLKDLTDAFNSKMSALINAFDDKKETTESLKTKTQNSFLEIRKMLDDKENELLGVLSEMNLRKNYLKKEMLAIAKKLKRLFPKTNYLR